jgi:hypothetical protein
MKVEEKKKAKRKTLERTQKKIASIGLASKPKEGNIGAHIMDHICCHWRSSRYGQHMDISICCWNEWRGTFLLAYLIVVFTFGLAFMVLELIVGRHYQKSII